MDELFDSDIICQTDHPEERGPRVHIPTEVCERIIDMLYSSNASDTFEDMTTLKRCALVSRSWRVRAQRMLFYKIQLSDGASLNRLSAILDTGRHLRQYVHEVVLVGHFLQTTASILPLFPVVFAGKLPNLHKLDIGSLQESDTSWFPRPPDPPKTKRLPHIPLHPRTARFLSSLTGVSHILLYSTTFRSFSEFARMLHGLPNLENLACSFVRWITPGGAYPGADFTSEPEWLPDGRTLPPFAPKLRKIWFRGVAAYGADQLVRTRGPHLTWPSIGIPLSIHLNRDEPSHDDSNFDSSLDPPNFASTNSTKEGPIDLSSCSGLQTLDVAITSEFSKDPTKSLDEFRSILASWKPRHPKPSFELKPFGHTRFTREDFTKILYALGPIVDTWLRTVEEPSSSADGDTNAAHRVKYQLTVEIHDWEAETEWWSDHIASCFPTWLRLGRLHMDFSTPPNRQWEWKADVEEESSTSHSPSVA